MSGLGGLADDLGRFEDADGTVDAKGSALHDAMSVAEVQGDLATSDARARWYDIQRRADDLAQTLYALREATPDPGEQARITDVLASLQAVRSAMDAGSSGHCVVHRRRR